MKEFSYHSPVDVRFGCGVRNELGEAASPLGKRGFLVVDPAISGVGMFRDFETHLGELFVGAFSEVEPNPSLACVESLVSRLQDAEADFVVALGGGSTMDAAKAAALAVGTGVSIRAVHSGKEPVSGKPLPLVAMPTTAGTGSEVTPVAVLTDKSRDVKAPIVGRSLFPRLALVDPEWTFSMPPAVTASTGMDALAHALEAYWCVNSQPISDAFAEKACCLVLGSLEQAFRDGRDVGARTDVSLGSLLAGLAFSQTKTAAVHACSFPLTRRWHVPHGAACALTLDAFLRFNAEAIPDKLERVAKVSGFGSVAELADRIRDLKRIMGLPISLEDAGVADDELEVLISECFHPNILNNPRKVAREDLLAIFGSLGR